ncbi:MAG: site-specific integrase [Planctomycetales bacterium]|nr:site-specific integrase [Planctomycetales bacterium]MBN8625546.1 site-specific integrase [Planctomycetota bacterium]
MNADSQLKSDKGVYWPAQGDADFRESNMVLHAGVGLKLGGCAVYPEDGIADFHAAGRHSHITGLIRSGASLPEGRTLARHTDIRQTMKYAHIGIDDQSLNATKR